MGDKSRTRAHAKTILPAGWTSPDLSGCPLSTRCALSGVGQTGCGHREARRRVRICCDFIQGWHERTANSRRCQGGGRHNVASGVNTPIAVHSPQRVTFGRNPDVRMNTRPRPRPAVREPFATTSWLSPRWARRQHPTAFTTTGVSPRPCPRLHRRTQASAYDDDDHASRAACARGTSRHAAHVPLPAHLP